MCHEYVNKRQINIGETIQRQINIGEINQLIDTDTNGDQKKQWIKTLEAMELKHWDSNPPSPSDDIAL